MALQPIAAGDTGTQAAAKILANDNENKASADLATTKANAAQAAIDDVTVKTPQLFNNDNMQAGVYNTDGAPSTSNNWIRTPLIPLEDGQTFISGSGMGTISAGVGRFFFYGAGGFSNFISKVDTTSGPTTSQTGAIPAGAKYVGLIVANVTDIGLDSTHSVYANTFMLNYGSPLPFEVFASGLDASRIIGEQPELTKVIADLDSVTVESNQLFNNAIMQVGSYNVSGGYVPGNINWICTPLIPIDALKAFISTSGAGGISASVGRFHFYGARGISQFISAALSTGTSQKAAIPAAAKFVSVNVANAVNIGLDPTHSVYANTFMLNYGDIIPYEQYALGLFLDGNKLKNGPAPVSGYPDGFYELNLTAATNGKPRFRVYSRYKNTPDYYAAIDVINWYDMSELVYSNQYRVSAAGQYRYDGTTMLTQNIPLITDGESECVYHVVGRADFTGGVHGDEIYQDVSFYADGQPISMATNIPLTKASIFEYRQNSETHETAATGNVVNPAHPVEAKHQKITTIANAGYTTYNRLKWQVAGLNVDMWYHGICCAGKNNGTFVENEYLERQAMIGDAVEKLIHTGARQYFAANATTKLGAQITSKLIKPAPYTAVVSGVVQIIDPDKNCIMFVWDRLNADNKYYRRFVPTVPIQIGDEWESIMQVQFFKQL